jgi:transposase InsO family protein
VDYIAGHRGEFGVEPICRVLTEHGCPIAPSTSCQAVSRRPSRRQLRDEQLVAVIAAERAGSRHVAGLGARKMWLRLRSQGHDVARCTAGRLMAQMGVTGLTRGARPQRTTRPDPAAARPADLVDRHFAAFRPNQLQVADFTYCPTWAGMVYVAFVFDVFARRILGWRAATAMTTPLVLDCLEQAIWTRRCEGTATWPAWCITPTRGRNIRRSRSPAAWPGRALTRRSGRSATLTTMPWPNRRSACSRPGCSIRTSLARPRPPRASNPGLGHLVQH